MFKILILLVLFNFYVAEVAGAANSYLLAFGDLRGNFEPCGCDPRTDVGGIARLSAVIDRYRQFYPDVVIAHLGNVVAKNETDLGKRNALMQALTYIKPEVTLLNVLDQENLDSGALVSSLNWLSTNYFPSKDPKIQVQRHLIIGPYEFYGFTRYNKNVRSGDVSDVIKYVRGVSKLKEPKYRVLLFSGSEDDLKEAQQAKIFGQIISSNSTALGVKKGDEERKNEQLLIRKARKEAPTWMVPYGATGLLRFGGLETMPLPTSLVNSLATKNPSLNQTTSFIKSENQNLLSLVTMVHWLNVAEETQISDQVSSIIAQYRAHSADSFSQFVKARSPRLSETKYAGVEACQNCHRGAFEIWKASKHASALATLSQKNRHEDLSCIECHVLGFHSESGYVSQSQSPNFANVQCESCHGPAKEHAANPSVKLKMRPFDECLTCHTPPHSPGFDRKSYWEKIFHK